MAKKSIYQKFLDFKKRHELSNNQIIQIVTEYAKSDFNFARSYFKEKYQISENTFYKARDFAVICCLVDEKICKLLRNKTATNYSNNNSKNSSTASLAHFQELMDLRKEFLANFSDEEIRDIGNKYVEGLSVEKIAIAYETGTFAIKYLLRKGIVMLIFNKDIVNQMRNLLGSSLNRILERRQSNKAILLACIEKEIDLLKMQIKYYDLYFRNIKDKPTLESLNDKLSQTIKKHQEAFQL